MMNPNDPIFIRVLNDQGVPYIWDPSRPGGSASYVDYWELVRLSGFPVCNLEDVDFESDKTYIFSPQNGNTHQALNRPHSCRLIYWNLERPPCDLPSYADEIWVSDRFYPSLLNDSRVKYVPLGGHPGLGGKVYGPKRWTLCHMSYAYGARLDKLMEFDKAGISIAPTAFGYERDEILARSKWGLALHQTDDPIIEPLRYVLFACWRLPVIAEKSEDYYPYKVFELDEWDRFSQHAMESVVSANYKMVTETITFRKGIEGAL